MTEKLYWQDSYLREFDAEVLAIEGTKVRLNQTAFNPRGGGLVSDTGIIGDVKVTEVLKEGEEIYHICSVPVTFSVGNRVHCALDWDRRYLIMKMHTTAHLLSAIVNKETGALITGNQISPQGSRIDFNLEAFDREKIDDYIRMANEAVKGAHEVKAYFMKREEALKVPGLVKLANAMPPSLDTLRIVQIGDVDTQADGGVHVANTKEIGEIIGKGTENKGKSNRRLYFTV